MNIISVDKFNRLRLSDFIDESKIAHLTNWEYREKIWIDEANGFTQFLQPENNTKVTQCISLDIQNINDEILWKISETLHIYFDKKTTKQDIIEDFGNSCKKETNDIKITTLTYKLPNYWVAVSFSEINKILFFEMISKN